MAIGTVYLIGAGPGHPGLITRLGYDLLHKCDAVLYDDLIPVELISELPADRERYYVGKRKGQNSTPQEITDNLLVELAKSGKDVARLKGGDPLIFGRGGEEIEILLKSDIPFVVVPGVSAVSAAAAGTGTPVTDRRLASWLLIATGRSADSPSPEVPWDVFGQASGGTIVVYMGLSTLEKTISGLISGGLSVRTPAMVVSNAYSGLQKVVQSTVSDIALRCANDKLNTPAVVLIGDTAGIPTQKGVSGGPLSGKSVLLTRPAGQTELICRLLRENGAEPMPLPTILIEPQQDSTGWSHFKRIIDRGGWCVFTSESGVKRFLDQLVENGLDYRALGLFKIAGIGSGTKRALSDRGLMADFVPEVARVKDFALSFVKQFPLEGVNVVRIRGNLSDSTIEDKALAKKASVIPLEVYRTRQASWDPHWIDRIHRETPHYILFTSGSTVEGFVNILGKNQVVEFANRSIVATIGPSTSIVAEQYGIKVSCEARIHSVEGLVDEVCRHALG